MKMNDKRNALFDADVLIHFAKANKLSLLKKLFPEYKLCVFDIVVKEIKYPQLLIDFIATGNEFEIWQFDNVNDEVYYENYRIKKELKIGDGEASCLAYARYNRDCLIISSNTKDIFSYCKENNITSMGILDCLDKAYHENLLTEECCNEFIKTVFQKRSILAFRSMDEYWHSKK